MCECSSSYHDINTYDTHNLFKATVCQHLWLAVKPSERSNVETIWFPQASHGWKKNLTSYSVGLGQTQLYSQVAIFLTMPQAQNVIDTTDLDSICVLWPLSYTYKVHEWLNLSSVCVHRITYAGAFLMRTYGGKKQTWTNCVRYQDLISKNRKKEKNLLCFPSAHIC